MKSGFYWCRFQGSTTTPEIMLWDASRNIWERTGVEDTLMGEHIIQISGPLDTPDDEAFRPYTLEEEVGSERTC